MALPLSRLACAAKLRIHWITALDAAASAVEVAVRARMIAPAVSAAEHRLLNLKRAWLERALGNG